VVFLVVFYVLSKRLYTRGIALITLFLMAFNTIESASRLIPATLGHAETPLFCAIIVLLSIQIALCLVTPYREMSANQRKKLILLCVIWGLFTGLAIWNDELSASFILASVVFLLFFCRKKLSFKVVRWVIVGLVIGILPLILHDVLYFQGQSYISGGSFSFSVFGFLSTTRKAIPMLQRWEEGFIVALPSATGASGVCYIMPRSAWPLRSHASAYIQQCTDVHAVWATLFAAVWLVAVLIEVRSLYLLKNRKDEPETVQKRILHAGRLLLLGGAFLSWFVFVSSMQVYYSAWSTRYLIAMMLATPAMLYPLWNAIIGAFAHIKSLFIKRGIQIVSALLLLSFVVAEVKGTVNAYADFPDGMVVEHQISPISTNQEVDILNNLERQHVNHLYSDYWTCNLVIFLSREKVICAATSNNDLTPGLNRYPPYQTIVQNNPPSAYLFQVGSPQIPLLNARLAQMHLKYHIIAFDGYVLYKLA
jgi:hypothetical protein